MQRWIKSVCIFYIFCNASLCHVLHNSSIPISSVNDDVCDCKDGSDEPGTSACKNSHFWCLNSGGRGFFIPSYQVNDGLCGFYLYFLTKYKNSLCFHIPDCCDGSDEADINGKTRCINTCRESSANPYIFLDRQKDAMEDVSLTHIIITFECILNCFYLPGENPP